MNEAGVFGRFVPDFGRVVAQMQFDMYHHYTVDEHSIRAIGLLAKIERGELAEDHPLVDRPVPPDRVAADACMSRCCCTISPRAGGGDHSVLGAEVALELGPRFGLDPGETETVAWLVRNHLLMSATAFKRDLADPKTIDDFVGAVQSPERLRLLLMLTVVDIRAVGPGTWNDWKRQLLRTLVRRRRGADPAGPQAARAERAGRGQAGRTGRRDWAGRRRRRGPMRGACPTVTGWPSRLAGRSPMRGRLPRPKRASAKWHQA